MERNQMLKEKRQKISHSISPLKSMTVKKLTRMKKQMKFMLGLLNKNNRSHCLHSRRLEVSRRKKTRMTMMKTRRKFQEHIIQLNLLVCRYPAKLKNCLSIFSDISHRKQIQIPSSSHSCQSTFPQQVKLMPSLRCLSLMVLKKTLV